MRAAWLTIALLAGSPALAAEATDRALVTTGMVATAAIPVGIALTWALWKDAPELSAAARTPQGIPLPQVWGVGLALAVGPTLTVLAAQHLGRSWRRGDRAKTLASVGTWGLILTGGALAVGLAGTIAYDDDAPFKDLPWGFAGVLAVSGALVSASAGGLALGGEDGPARLAMGPTVSRDQLGWAVAGVF